MIGRGLPSSLANGDKDDNGRDKNDHEDFWGSNQYGSHVNKHLLTGTRVWSSVHTSIISLSPSIARKTSEKPAWPSLSGIKCNTLAGFTSYSGRRDRYHGLSRCHVEFCTVDPGVRPPFMPELRFPLCLPCNRGRNLLFPSHAFTKRPDTLTRPAPGNCHEPRHSSGMHCDVTWLFPIWTSDSTPSCRAGVTTFLSSH